MLALYECANWQIVAARNLLANESSIRKQHANKIQMCVRQAQERKTAKARSRTRFRGVDRYINRISHFAIWILTAAIAAVVHSKSTLEIDSTKLNAMHNTKKAHHLAFWQHFPCYHHWTSMNSERRSTMKVTATATRCALHLANEQNTFGGTLINAIAWLKLTFSAAIAEIWKAVPPIRIIFWPEFSQICRFTSTFSSHRP